MALTGVLLAVLTFTSSCGARATETAAPAPPPGMGTPMDGPVPASILSAPLVDSEGHQTTLGAMRGKVIVLSDVMTLCQESCPIITAGMVSAARALDRTPLGRHVEFVSLTIDPTRDDARHLRAYQRQFGALNNWTLLTGTRAAVDQIWHTLGVWRHLTRLTPPYPRDWVTGAPLTTDIAHTDELIFINADQRFRYEMDGYGNVSPSTIPKRIYGFMDKLGHRNLTARDAQSWTPSQVTQVLHWVVGSST